MQFPFDQSLLMPTKLQASMNMYQQMLQTLAAPEMMKTQRETAQQDLLTKQLMNKYYPQSTQADIDYKNAQVPYLGAQTAQTKAQTQAMPLDQIIKEQMAYNDAGKLAQSQNRFNQVQALSSYLKSNVGQSQFAQDKPFAAAATRVMSGLASDDDYATVAQKTGNQSAFQSNLYQNLLPKFAQQAGVSNYMMPGNGQAALPAPQGMSPQSSPPMPPQQMQTGMPQPTPQGAPSAMPQGNQPGGQQIALSPAQAQAIMQSKFGQPGGPQPPVNASPAIPGNMPIPKPVQAPIPAVQPSTDIINQSLKSANISPDHADSITSHMQSQIADMLEKRSTTTSILNQRQYANTFNNLFKQVQDYLPSIYKFSGVQGHLKLQGAKLLAATGLYTDPDLIKYNAFENSIKAPMAADLRRKLGGQGTDQEVNHMMNVIDPSVSWFGNAAIAKGQMKALQDASRAADQSIVQSPTEAKSSLMNQQPVMNQQNTSAPQIEEKTENGRLMRRLPGKPWKYVDEL